MPHRLLAGLLTVLLLVCATARAEEARVTVLHFNDIYEFTPGGDSGGFAALATLVERERAAHPGALLTFGGDLLSPSVTSGMTKGAHMIDLLNGLAPDAAVPGNHELDFGADILRRRMAESVFPWLVDNLAEADGTPFGGGRRLLMVEAGGVRVGLFGLLTTQTAALAADARGVRFLPEADTARAAVAELRHRGAELVIALTHQDLAQDLALARIVEGIDLILGGHDHNAVAMEEGRTLVVKAGHDGIYLAAVDLAVERPGPGGGPPRIRPLGWRLTASRDVPEQPSMAARMRRHADAAQSGLDQRLAVLAAPLDSRQDVVRGAESSLGDFVADSARAALDAEVALVNGGGLRGNRLYPAGATLTRGDLLREMPFGNHVVLLEVDGATLRAALEHGVSRLPALSGRFPQVSGMSFGYTPAAPPGQRVRTLTIGGKSVAADGRYRLATSDYLAQGGDGYAMLAAAKVLVRREAAPLLVTVVAEQAERQARLTAIPDGRITVAPP